MAAPSGSIPGDAIRRIRCRRKDRLPTSLELMWRGQITADRDMSSRRLSGSLSCERKCHTGRHVVSKTFSRTTHVTLSVQYIHLNARSQYDYNSCCFGGTFQDNTMRICEVGQSSRIRPDRHGRVHWSRVHKCFVSKR